MVMILDENEKELSNTLVFSDKDGRVALVIGLLMTVYFDNRLTRPVRDAVAEVSQDYVDLVREHLLWSVPVDQEPNRPIGSEPIDIKKYLSETPDGESWGFAFHGGKTPEHASPFFVEAFAGAHPVPKVGYLHMAFPLLWFAERSETFPDFVRRVCQRVRPLSGYAGIGVIEPADLHACEKFQPVVRGLAERHPGLEVEDRIGHGLRLYDGIKGVNWLTVLGDRWIKEMGGLDYLRIRLGEEFGFYPYDGGVIIQAGPKPQLGDVEANRWPRLYATLAKVLKKIQITKHGPFHLAGPNRRYMDKDASMAWLFRFDGK